MVAAKIMIKLLIRKRIMLMMTQPRIQREKANEVSETSGACVALGASCLQLGVWAAL